MMTPTFPPIGFAPYGRIARISRDKLTGLGKHEGVLLSNGMVVHISAERGVQVCSYDTFRANRIVTVEMEVPRQFHDIAMMQVQALLHENAPYDLIANNCEIFARKAVLERPLSPQVAFWTLTGIFLGIFALGTQ